MISTCNARVHDGTHHVADPPGGRGKHPLRPRRPRRLTTSDDDLPPLIEGKEGDLYLLPVLREVPLRLRWRSPLLDEAGLLKRVCEHGGVLHPDEEVDVLILARDAAQEEVHGPAAA